MRNGPFVFVDVDTQRDFLEPSGALYIRGSEPILKNLARLTNLARANEIPVLATACAHSPGDDELYRFPTHCMIGTRGQERIEATTRPDGTVLGPDELLFGPIPDHLTIQKRAIDFFSHPDADRLVSLYNHRHPTFVVYGVATDYCVERAVSGLLDRRCRVSVVVDAIRAFDSAREADILTKFAQRGALLTLTEAVCED